MPKVSVIMNCLNGENFVRQAIQSVYDQTFQDWEIIFWDNASTDSTPEIAKSFGDGRLRYFRSRETVPLGKARQWAMAEARGEWVQLLDHDDFLTPDAFGLHVSAMGASSASGPFVLSYGGYTAIDETGALIRTHIPQESAGDLFGRLLRNMEIYPMCAWMNRRALNTIDFAATSAFVMAEEYNYFLKLALTGNACAIPSNVGTYRILSTSQSGKTSAFHAKEVLQTLDELAAMNPEKALLHKNDFRLAFARAQYLQAQHDMSVGNFAKARSIMRRIGRDRPAYALLSLAALAPPVWKALHNRSVKVALTSFLIRR